MIPQLRLNFELLETNLHLSCLVSYPSSGLRMLTALLLRSLYCFVGEIVLLVFKKFAGIKGAIDIITSKK